MTRYAVRNPCGEWRSSRWSESFGNWDAAQLWENAKTAELEVRRWKEHWVWRNSIRVPSPVEAEIVAITIPEPK